MSQKLTPEYIDAHMGENDRVYREAGKLLSDAILNDAKAYINEHGPSEKVILTPTIEIQPLQGICIQVCYRDNSGNTICYHREI